MRRRRVSGALTTKWAKKIFPGKSPHSREFMGNGAQKRQKSYTTDFC